jgi:hypothetical protein
LRTLKAAAVILSLLTCIWRRSGANRLGAADVLSTNLPTLRVFERSGLAINTRREDTVVHVTLHYP